MGGPWQFGMAPNKGENIWWRHCLVSIAGSRRIGRWISFLKAGLKFASSTPLTFQSYPGPHSRRKLISKSLFCALLFLLLINRWKILSKTHRFVCNYNEHKEKVSMVNLPLHVYMCNFFFVYLFFFFKQNHDVDVVILRRFREFRRRKRKTYMM